MSRRFLLWFFLGLALAGSPVNAGFKFERLRSFGIPDQVGENPQTPAILGTDGRLYGTTSGGITGDAGTVFKLNLDGTGYHVLHRFNTVVNDGTHPAGYLVDGGDGALYGTTGGGPAVNVDFGVIFRVSKDGRDYRILHNFGSIYGDGFIPIYAGLILASDGALYGTTFSGGLGGYGTVFRINKDGSGYTVLHNFSRFEGELSPLGGVIEGTDGALYGTTYMGGTGNVGTIYRLNKDGSGYAPVYWFGNASGPQLPQTSLIQGSDGSLYGTTINGAVTNATTVFRVNCDGSGFMVLHVFANAGIDESYPFGALIQGSDGILYGTTVGGGTRGNGTVFKLNTDGSGYGIVHNFDGVDGGAPFAALLEGPDGFLYSTSTLGGANNLGTVFKVQKDGSGYAILRSFTYAGGDGQHPVMQLVDGGQGILFGTTARGGNTNAGTAFSLNTSGNKYEILHSFGSTGIGGIQPEGLEPGPDGNLYGTTYGGGAANQGLIFRMSRNGSEFSILHAFGTSGSDGSSPRAGLLISTSGALYGTAGNGGSGSVGTVFTINEDGSGYAILHTFGTTAGDGSRPGAALIRGRDGQLYGTTLVGGSRMCGTVFGLSPDGGGYRILHSFCSIDNGSDGRNPASALVEGGDGALYGTTVNGGSNNLGMIFKVDKDGTAYQILHSFGDAASDGQRPYASLVQGSDGALYGTTLNGGSNNFGAIFTVNTDGTAYRLLYSFGAAAGDGRNPYASLMEDRGGWFYGTTYAGGDLGVGTVFRFRLRHEPPVPAIDVAWPPHAKDPSATAE